MLYKNSFDSKLSFDRKNIDSEFFVVIIFKRLIVFKKGVNE